MILNNHFDGMYGKSFSYIGIDDDFIKTVQREVTEGTSALFLLTGAVTLDKVQEAVKGEVGEWIRSNLTHEQEQKLQADCSE